MRRYDLFLPVAYNDGTMIEEAKFSLVENELLAIFGAFTVNSISAPYKGAWKYGGVEYRDDIIIFFIVTEADKQADEFFHTYKEVLKERFQQIEILITIKKYFGFKFHRLILYKYCDFTGLTINQSK